MWQVKKTVKFEQKVIANRLTAEEAYDVVDRLVAEGAARELFQVQSVADNSVAVIGFFFKKGDYGVTIHSVGQSAICFGLSHPNWCSERYVRHLKGKRAGHITGRKFNGNITPSRVSKIPPEIREWIMSLEVK